jgi:hypothetical protein
MDAGVILSMGYDVYRRALPLVCALGASFSPFVADAAHPTLTEDAGTQGEGKFELELGLERAREGSNRAFEFGPQLSWGLLENVDLIVRPPWLDVRTDGVTRRGPGDTALDVKWRFFERDGFSAGTRAGVDLPSGDSDKGLGAGKASWHALLIASFYAEPWSFSANAGYVHQPLPDERRDVAAVSVSALWVAREGLKFSLDVAAEQNADPADGRWPAVARLGMIYTLNEHWDLDVGYQTRLNHAAPESVILAGATVRW